jgi:hypothetical protein
VGFEPTIVVSEWAKILYALDRVATVIAVPEIFLGSKARPARKADNLTAICKPIV